MNYDLLVLLGVLAGIFTLASIAVVCFVVANQLMAELDTMRRTLAIAEQERDRWQDAYEMLWKRIGGP